MDVRDQRFELILGALCCEVGDLRLEAAREVRRRVGDAFAELEDGVRASLELTGKLDRVGIEADAEQRVVFRPGGVE